MRSNFHSDTIVVEILYNNTLMQGISFVVDEKGDKKAVLIDLERYGELWEDFYDVLISQEREDEEEIDWEDLKEESVRKDG